MTRSRSAATLIAILFVVPVTTILVVRAVTANPDWEDRNGGAAPVEEIRVHGGHCRYEDRTVLFHEGRRYLKDPHAEEGYFPHARLPASARFTGYRSEGRELWVDPRDGGTNIYLVHSDRVERWPEQTSFCD